MLSCMYTYRLIGLVFRALCSLLPVWDRHTFSLNFWSSCLHFPSDRVIGCQLQLWMVLRNIKIFSPKKLLLFIYFYWPESSITVIPCSKQCGIVAWYVVKFIAWPLKTMTSHHWASWWYFSWSIQWEFQAYLKDCCQIYVGDAHNKNLFP